MNLLLDTHVALWAITDSPKLSVKAKELIQSPKSTVWISVASIWEISIKHSLGRGDMPVSGKEAASYFEQSGFRFLPIDLEHTLTIQDLPAHHQDPFDRILIAQSLVEPMRLMTHDANVIKYNETIISV